MLSICRKLFVLSFFGETFFVELNLLVAFSIGVASLKKKKKKMLNEKSSTQHTAN